MKYLNIDALTPEAKKIEIGGKKYDVKEFSVAEFMETNKRLSALLKREDATQADFIEEQIQSVLRAIPDMSEDLVRSLTVKQLGQIIEFIRNEDDEEGKDGGAEESDKTSKKK